MCQSSLDIQLFFYYHGKFGQNNANFSKKPEHHIKNQEFSCSMAHNFLSESLLINKLDEL